MGESLNHNTFLGDLRRRSIKTWKSRPSFVKFQSMSILAIRDNRGQETVSTPKIVLNNKSGLLFLEFGRCEGKF